MARINRVETCMFCDSSPCACNAKPKAAPKPKKPAQSTPVEKPVEIVPEVTAKPGPFAAAGFVHASVALRDETASPLVVQDVRDGDKVAHAKALKNVLDYFGRRNIHPDDVRTIEKKIKEAGLDE